MKGDYSTQPGLTVQLLDLTKFSSFALRARRQSIAVLVKNQDMLALHALIAPFSWFLTCSRHIVSFDGYSSAPASPS